jgi:hypothetical protein
MKRALLVVWGLTFSASAQIVSTDKTYDERLRQAQISALGTDLFGDQINLKDGTVQFSQTDVSLATNSDLRVEFTRRTPRQKQGLDRAQMPLGAGWEMDVPYMMATYDTRRGWDARGSTARCSSTSLQPSEWVGPSPNYNTRVMPFSMYWSGIYINIPRAGYESLLKLKSGHTVPQDGVTYIGSTNSFWRVGCLATIKNGAGEGFFVRLPNGKKYYFDWMAARNAWDVLDSDYYRDANGDGTNPTGLLVPTSDVFLYATKVEDRFGNYLEYEYDAVNKHQLKSVSSNDGVRIDLVYDSYGKVAEVKTSDRVWTYKYADSYYGKKLSEVILPDQSSWSFPAGTAYHNGAMWWYMLPVGLPGGFYMNSCAEDATGYRSQDTPNSADVTTITMKHPSGAIGEFTWRPLIHGSDNTPGGCGLFGTSSSSFWFGSYGIPSAYLARSLTTKKITGPGLAPATWTYTYQSRWSFSHSCTGTICRSSTIETRPDGSTVEYVFGNIYTANAGDLLVKTVKQGSTVLEQTSYQMATTPVNYPETAGDLLAEGNPLTTKLRPNNRVEIRRDGRLFTKSVEQFDQFAQPARVVKSSANLP